METFYGIGLIAGPLMGGFLYQVGGYTLPFVCVGGLLFLAAFCTHFVLPKTRSIKGITDSPVDGKISSGFSIFKIMRIPAVALAAFSIFSASTSLGFLNATLEPHVRQVRRC
jgi:MFS family permease